MFTGAHILLYSTNADADRAFIRDVLGFSHIDVGGGWLIFALPPAELAVHPSEATFSQNHGATAMMGSILYLMCADLKSTLAQLHAKGVSPNPTMEADWGIATSIPLPSGAHLGLYQPKHPVAFRSV